VLEQEDNYIKDTCNLYYLYKKDFLNYLFFIQNNLLFYKDFL